MASFPQAQVKHVQMIRNYLLVAWRSLFRSKVFSFVNISGLALGIACSLLILLWVQDEKSVDSFHRNADQLYQVYERNFFDGKIEAAYQTQGLLAQELQKKVPEIKYASGFERVSAPGTFSTFRAGEKIGKRDGYFAGENFFNMFSFGIIAGSGNSLDKPEAIVISRSMAEFFYGSASDAVGKSILFENKENLIVTAVFENISDRSSLQFDFIRSWSAFVNTNSWVNNWGNTDPQTFVLLHPGVDAGRMPAKIKNFIFQYKPKEAGIYTELALQPFTERYLHSSFDNGEISGGRIVYVQLFTVIACFILLIACINFMNLATARAVKRSKEIGVRKVMGANRLVLVKQFLGEALMLTTIAAAVALIIALLLLPAFNELTGKDLALPVHAPLFWLALLIIVLVTGIIAGSYPALFLSSLHAVSVLKSALTFNRGAVFFRKSLVVFQFSLSVILIVGVIVIYRQVDYIQSKNLGYNRQNLLYIPIEGELVKDYPLFKTRAQKLNGVLSVSKMRNSPTFIEHHTNSISWPGKDTNNFVSFADAVVGYDFVKTMDLEMKSGRDFSKDFGSDSTGYLLNETAVNKMQLENPLGTTVSWGNKPGPVVGVIRDFHFASFHQQIEPLIVRLDENWGWGTILVRIDGSKTRNVLGELESLCSSINPDFPFTFQFSDDQFSKLYYSEQVAGKVAAYFASLAIFISCLGLFGLAAFTASQRKKEVGVRKVLGASATNIVAMLATNFLKPVGIAIIIAIPFSLLVMDKWLQNFEYRVGLDWWIFAVAGVVAVSIALATVSVQAIRSALANPVNSLRNE